MSALSGSDPATGILEVHISQNGDAVTLALAGEFDLASVDIVKQRFAEAMDGGSSRIVVDLRELSFIDSSGISFLLSAVKGDGGERLHFIPSASATVQRIFSVTGVTELFGGGTAARQAGSKQQPRQPDGELRGRR